MYVLVTYDAEHPHHSTVNNIETHASSFALYKLRRSIKDMIVYKSICNATMTLMTQLMGTETQLKFCNQNIINETLY